MPSELDSTLSSQSSASDHNISIDILKGLMIMLVIIDHAIPTAIRAEWGHSLWERISIPVFLIIMGINAANSFKKNGIPTSFKGFLHYYGRKLKRYLLPFALIYVISTIVGLAINGTFEMLLQNQFDDHWEREMLWALMLPFYGPGNWFIPVLFQAAIVIPLLYWVYTKSPKIVLALSVMWEIGVQWFIFTYFGHWTAWWPNFPLGRTLIQLSVFLYFNGIVLGFWLADHLYFVSPKPPIPSDIQVPPVETSSVEATPLETPEATINVGSSLTTSPRNAKSLPTKLPWHFYLTLISVILIFAIFLRPWLEPRTSASFAVAAILIGIFLVIGLYTYRPLLEFLLLIVTAAVIFVAFSLVLGEYFGNTGVNYGDMTVEARMDLFFVSAAIFLLPYLINIFFSPTNKNWFLWIMALISGLYLCAYQFDGFRFFQITGDYHFFVYPWSAFIILFFATLIRKDSKFVLFRGFAFVGKATYHILLTQIFVYGIMISQYGTHYFEGSLMWEYLIYPDEYNQTAWLYVVIMWLICIPIGVLWYLGEKRVLTWLKEKNARKNTPPITS